MIIKPYPKDNESRTFGVRPAWLEEVAEHIRIHGIGRDELLFSTEVGTPISRNTFRTRVWLPAVKASGIDFGVRVHDLRHAHASWLLAGGADLKGVMDRMGHAQIQTTQKYLHTLPDTDQKNLDALTRIAGRISEVSHYLIERTYVGKSVVAAKQPAEGTRRTRVGPSRGSSVCDRSSQMAGRLIRAARRPSID